MLSRTFMVATVLLSTYLSVLPAGILRAAEPQTEDQMLESFQTHKISVEGELIKLKMRESDEPATPWEELGIKTPDGKIFILIGKLVKDIRKDVGKMYVIKGNTKPAMIVKKEPVTVIQIVFAQRIGEDPADKASTP